MQTLSVIGRNPQKQLFEEALNSSKSEFMVVYGRRRVGKTFLIKNVLGNRIDFEMTGIQNGDLKDQLQNFANKLFEFGEEEIKAPKSWMQAFTLLKKYLSKLNPTQKKVIFLDELSNSDNI